MLACCAAVSVTFWGLVACTLGSGPVAEQPASEARAAVRHAQLKRPASGGALVRARSGDFVVMVYSIPRCATNHPRAPDRARRCRRNDWLRPGRASSAPADTPAARQA